MFLVGAGVRGGQLPSVDRSLAVALALQGILVFGIQTFFLLGCTWTSSAPILGSALDVLSIQEQLCQLVRP